MKKFITEQFTETSALKEYLNVLPNALSQRYGNKSTYSKGQVDATVAALGLSHKHVHLAYLNFCEESVCLALEINPRSLDKIYQRMESRHKLATRLGLGFLVASRFSSGDVSAGGGTGGCEGGGGGDGC